MTNAPFRFGGRGRFVAFRARQMPNEGYDNDSYPILRRLDVDELIHWFGSLLAEDAQTARRAGGRSEQTWEVDLSGKDPLGQSSWPAVVRYTTDGRLRGAVAHLPVMQERSEDRMVHIARHDPARVLREIGADQQLLAQYAAVAANDVDEVEYANGWAQALGLAVRLRASAYADRPGYREEWRP